MSTTVASWRTAIAVRVTLVAVLAGAIGYGSYALTSQSVSEVAEAPAPEDNTAAPFTTADVGACLTWETGEDGTVRQFERTDCEGPHLFEVSAREDLGTYPSAEFGADAPRPELTRQAQLREELCQAVTMRYLDGQLDPGGRYSIASILPPQSKWDAGDRTLLCGVQSTDVDGTVLPTQGRAGEQDQARVAEPGTCLRVDSANQTIAVDCAEPHHMEITDTVYLGEHFPEGIPSEQQQDDYLRDRCTDAAMEYLGDEEALYQSTLQPYWGTLPEVSWAGGSRSVNCALVFANEERGFAELAGSARGDFTIDGQAPEEQPERDPIRTPVAPPPVEGE